MADVFPKAKRSQIMARIKGSGNHATEKRLIGIFRKHRISGWRRGAKLAGKPDFVFKNSRLAVFVDGCFWHGCQQHGSLPKSNSNFWRNKLLGNMARDKLVNKRLKSSGWAVVRIWQHELREPNRVVNRLRRHLQD